MAQAFKKKKLDANISYPNYQLYKLEQENLISLSFNILICKMKITLTYHTREIFMYMYTEGEQNLPLQNMSFWHKDYFRLIIFKKQQTYEKL